jgi:hypothetical protein
LTLTGYPISISGPVPHPQALLSDQPKLDAPPQPLEFSKDMSCEQLAVWLTNHPQLVGADYQQDISKLKGIISNLATQVIVIVYIVANWILIYFY